MRLYFALIVILFASCSKKSSEHRKLDAMQNYQVSIEELKVTDPSTVKINILTKSKSENTRFSINSRSKGIYQVTAFIPGFLESVKVEQGQKIRKGDLLAILSHPDYLDLKTKYLEVKNELEYHKKNYARQGELAIEMATSIKKMEIAERDYKQAEIKYAGLEEKIKFLGINAKSLNSEKLNSLAYIFSKANGKIEHIDAIPGQYCPNGFSILTLSTGSEKYISSSLRNMNPRNPVNILNVSIIQNQQDTINLSDYLLKKEDFGYSIEAKLPDNFISDNSFVNGIITQSISYMELPKTSIIGNDQIMLLNKLNSNLILRQIRVIEIKTESVECFPIHIPDGYELVETKAHELYQYLLESEPGY